MRRPRKYSRSIFLRFSVSASLDSWVLIFTLHFPYLLNDSDYLLSFLLAVASKNELLFSLLPLLQSCIPVVPLHAEFVLRVVSAWSCCGGLLLLSLARCSPLWATVEEHRQLFLLYSYWLLRIIRLSLAIDHIEWSAYLLQQRRHTIILLERLRRTANFHPRLITISIITLWAFLLLIWASPMITDQWTFQYLVQALRRNGIVEDRLIAGPAVVLRVRYCGQLVVSVNILQMWRLQIELQHLILFAFDGCVVPDIQGTALFSDQSCWLLIH